MAINVSVQHNGEFLPGIILLTQCYYHRGTRLNAIVSGTRFSMLDWVRVTGLSCTKGVWYIYDWDTRSSILPLWKTKVVLSPPRCKLLRVNTLR